MSVLVVDSRVPDPELSAAERAVVDFADACRDAGNHVGFAALKPFSDDARRATVLQSRGISVGPSGNLPDALAGSRWDFVVVNGHGPGVVASTALAAAATVPVLFGHDLQSVRLAGQREVTAQVPGHLEALTVIAERRCWQFYPLTVYPARWEADHVNRATDGTAAAMAYFRLMPEDLPPLVERPRSGLLMVGSEAHAPNLDAVEVAVRDILPLTGEDLTVVGLWSGATRSRLGGARVRFTGLIPEEQLRALHRTHRALLAPLRFGAGTRRKIVAAMGLGLPVITTTQGARGLLIDDATPADGILICERAQEVAAAIEALEDSGFAAGRAAMAQQRAREVFGQQAYDDGVAAMLELAGEVSGRARHRP